MFNKHIKAFRAPDSNHWNHNSMAGGRYYIKEELIGKILAGWISESKLDIALTPYAKKKTIFFADIDNVEKCMYTLYIYIVFS